MAYVQYSSVIPQKKEEIFKYITDVSHIPSLLPDDYKLKLNAPAIPMREGAEYEFTFSRYGVSYTWSVRIEEFEPSKKFSQRQILGLFDSWVHTCKLEDHGDQNTLMTNFIEYSTPLGLLGRLFDDLFLRRDLRAMLEKAHQNLTEKVK